MAMGRKSYVDIDLDGIRCSKRRRAVKWHARVYVATPPWAETKEIYAIYRKARAQGQVVDHIIPLFGAYVCGLHTPDNLRIVSAELNQAKSNQWWPDMPNEPGILNLPSFHPQMELPI